MKPTSLLLFAVFLVGCAQSSDPKTPEKGLPRIEFIECDGSPTDFSLERAIYLNKETTITGDTTTISFDFVRDCCLEYEGTWKIEDEKLTLGYQLKGENQLPCDCKCVYSMKYHFNRDDYSWKSVRIKRKNR